MMDEKISHHRWEKETILRYVEPPMNGIGKYLNFIFGKPLLSKGFLKKKDFEEETYEVERTEPAGGSEEFGQSEDALPEKEEGGQCPSPSP